MILDGKALAKSIKEELKAYLDVMLYGICR